MAAQYGLNTLKRDVDATIRTFGRVSVRSFSSATLRRHRHHARRCAWPGQAAHFVYTESMSEWDPRKAEANAAKHGVSFDEAVTMFSTPMPWMARTCSTRRPKCGTCGWAEPPTGACSWWPTRSGEVAMPKQCGSSVQGGRVAGNARRTGATD